ncbi:hypothetical protein KDE12_07750 [Campylobacter sp. faydin G-105]|uniref:hypothetical protein n=1 Tax=Campylobacter anatolicus TaxID=2829105 RepID=UPI001B8FD869|nr:hypothetical protein [Campylobacter anatolicus]MBR8462733.1 hypothetical protein [Campylobacter anatolicus]
MRAVLIFLLSLSFIFANTDINVLRKYATELNTRGFELKDIVKLGNSDEYEIYRIAMSKSGWAVDLYAFISDGKIVAVRSLAQTAMLREIVSEYDGLDNDIKSEIDIINLRLILASDSELLKFGRENAIKFEIVYELYNDGENSVAELKRELLDLHFNMAELNEEYGVFTLIIGGMLDNIVGFFRCDDLQNMPQMSPNRIIMIEKVAKNWYLFKTT